MEHGGEYAISVHNYKGSAYRTCHVVVEHAMRPPAMPDLLSSCDEYCSRSDLYLSDDTDTEHGRSIKPSYVKEKFKTTSQLTPNSPNQLSTVSQIGLRICFIYTEICAWFLNNLVCQFLEFLLKLILDKAIFCFKYTRESALTSRERVY